MKKNLLILILAGFMAMSLLACGASKTSDTDAAEESDSASTEATVALDSDDTSDGTSADSADGTSDAADSTQDETMASQISEAQINLESEGATTGDSDDALAEAVSDLFDMMPTATASEIVTLITSDSFTGSFDYDDTTLAKVTATDEDGNSLIVTVGNGDVSVSLNKNDTYIYVEAALAGSIYMKTSLSGDNYDGDFVIEKYDTAGNKYLSASGTFDQGLITGDITITMNGKDYQGSLSDEGKIETEQSGDGLALATSGSDALYVNGENQSSFVLDAEFFGLPKEYER